MPDEGHGKYLMKMNWKTLSKACENGSGKWLKQQGVAFMK